MGGQIPFDEDVMTLIMGVTPDEPGMHGRKIMPKPGDDAIDVVMKIRDMCDEFLLKAGKCEQEPMEEGGDSEKPSPFDEQRSDSGDEEKPDKKK